MLLTEPGAGSDLGALTTTAVKKPDGTSIIGVEEKLGLHGSPTCSLALGGKGGCRGVLLRHDNKGMQEMFHMMNEARLDGGAQGFTHALQPICKP